MYDALTEKDVDDFLHRSGATRRQFGKLSAAAGLGIVWPPVATAQDVHETNVEVMTPDGVADCYFVRPSTGEHPAVLIWPDLLGLRLAFKIMGKRLAQSGYSVLVVNPFYRDARSPVRGGIRDVIMPMARNLNAETHVSDARAFIRFS